MSQPLGFIVEYLVTLLAALGLALYTSWRISLVTLSSVPVTAIIMSFISSKMQPSIAAQEEGLAKASKLANSAISSIDTVKAFNGQDLETRQYNSAILHAAKSYLKQAKINSLQIGFVRFVTLAMFVQGFWYGSHLVNTGKLSTGKVLTAFWACLMATKAAEDILPFLIVLEKGRAAGAGLKAILMQVGKGKAVDRNHSTLKEPEFCEGDIEMRDVSSL